MALVLIPFALVGYGFALVFKWSRARQKERKDYFYGIPAGVIFVLFLSFWLAAGISLFNVLSDVSRPISKYCPGTSRYLVRQQKNIDGLFDWVKRGEILGFMNEKRPYRMVWLICCGPLAQIGFMFFLFKSKDPWKQKLEKYNYRAPDKINFAKEEVRACKLAKKWARAKKEIPITFLGYDYKYNRPAFIYDGERYRHTHIVGGTGSGKTTSLLFPMMWQDIKKGRGVLFVDAKGDIEAAQTIHMLAKARNRLDDFLFFSLASPEKSSTYNPLALGNSTQLKDKIIGTINFTEPHYQRECENGLQILFNDLGAEKKTLRSVNEILKKPPERLTNFFDFYDGHKKNISGIQSEISLLVNSEVGELFEGDEINLLDAYKQGKIVYFALNTLTYGETAARVGRLITGDINTLCGLLQNTTERRDFAIYIDEYGAFGTPGFATTLSQGRSAGFMITIAHQSISDLKKISEQHAGQVKSNTAVKIIMKSSGEDAEDFANELGTYKDIQMTRQVAMDGIMIGQQMGTEKIVDEYLINPQEIRQLDIGQAAYKTLYVHGVVSLPYIKYLPEELEEIPGRAQKAGPEKPEEKPVNGDPTIEPKNIFDV